MEQETRDQRYGIALARIMETMTGARKFRFRALQKKDIGSVDPNALKIPAEGRNLHCVKRPALHFTLNQDKTVFTDEEEEEKLWPGDRPALRTPQPNRQINHVVGPARESPSKLDDLKEILAA